MKTNRSKKLFIIWMILLVISSGITHWMKSSTLLQADVSTLPRFRSDHLFAFVSVAFFDLPFMIIIHRVAKKEKSKKILLFSKILLAIIISWLIFATIFAITSFGGH